MLTVSIRSTLSIVDERNIGANILIITEIPPKLVRNVEHSVTACSSIFTFIPLKKKSQKFPDQDFFEFRKSELRVLGKFMRKDLPGSREKLQVPHDSVRTF